MLDVVLKRLHHRPVAYYPIYTKIMGSTAGGVILSQILYWWGAVDGREFYKTDVDIREETGVTLRELREAKAKMKTLPFLTTTVKGSPPKCHYSVDAESLFTFLTEFVSVQNDLNDGVKIDSNDCVQNDLNDGVKIYNTTENTTENTTDTIVHAPTNGDARTQEKDWPEEFQSVKKALIDLEILPPFNDPAYWKAIETWTDTCGFPIYYLDELRAYHAYQIALPPGGKHKHRDMKKGFRTWIANAINFRRRDAERKASWEQRR